MADVVPVTTIVVDVLLVTTAFVQLLEGGFWIEVDFIGHKCTNPSSHFNVCPPISMFAYTQNEQKSKNKCIVI